MKYFKTELKEFINSFKLKFNFIQILLFDLIFYIVVLPSIYLAALIINRQGVKVDTTLLTPEAIATASELEITLLSSQVRSLVVWTLVSFAVVFILALLTWSFTRGLIYTKLLKQKFTLKYFKKFIGLNIFLIMALIPILVFLAVLLKAELMSFIVVSVALLLAVAYFISLIYIQFTKNKQLKVFASIGEGLSLGAKKFKKLLLPGILIIIVGYIINVISVRLPPSTYTSIILFAIFMAWARIYFVSTVERV